MNVAEYQAAEIAALKIVVSALISNACDTTGKASAAEAGLKSDDLRRLSLNLLETSQIGDFGSDHKISVNDVRVRIASIFDGIRFVD